MNFYKFYVGDYVRDTKRLTIRQDGVYRRLLDEYYATETPLPLDHEECYRIVVATNDDERADVDLILDRYFFELDGCYHNEKADSLIEQASKQRATNRRIAAQRTVDEPSTKRSTNRATNRTTSNPTNRSPNQTPDTRQLKKEDSKKEFDEWYEHYPLKKARGRAETAFNTARKHVDLETLIAATKRYAAEVAGTNYVKHPATWLNGKCWLDEPEGKLSRPDRVNEGLVF